ncbi:MAG: VWA domain-containing protein [Chloroflexi bacterium]|uniref:VWA domain-containing protein n=1 Tax=Candidatus Chlorohelix allophototropha TaxID=3003348 RepID=A0A8T7M7M8_9CHLR|nr:VWA domain-containing protein [Chloroflexota bacterium]WJW68002.1 VWA domain-containing protein [Chloroflexota bacterium L227-S17]
MLYRYSRWDGTQQVFPFDAEEIMEELSKELIDDNFSDLNNALQKLYRWGLNGPMNERMPGLQDLMEKLRAMRQAEMNRYDLDSVMQDIKEKLDSIVNKEQTGLQRRLDETANSEEKALRQLLEKQVAKKQQFLRDMPKDPGGQLRKLSDYEFMDADARQEFQELMQMIQQQILGSYFQGMKQAMENITPEDMNQMREMVQDLNQMLQDRAQGKEPKFQQFMQKWGQFFPPGINSLDELIKHMQKQMAQMQSLMNSMSPEQRRQLESMMQAMLKDDRMRMELARLAANLEQLYPMRGMNQRYPFQGDEQLGLGEAMDLMQRLQQMDQLEQELKDIQYGRKGLNSLDEQQLQDLMGEEAAATLERLKELTRILEEAGYIEKNGNRFELTPRGMRKIGQKALKDIFTQLKKDSFGKHKTSLVGSGGERTDIGKKYEFGDPFLLDLEETVMNAVFREGQGTPVRIRPEDFEVYRTELMTSSSTVLMLDMSRSMILRNCWAAAKKVAMALNALIRSQFPRDNLYIIGFSDRARMLQPESLTQITWNEYVYGTNMQHGFMMARQLLGRHKSGNKQIIMITDGEPTAHIEEDGEVFFSYPPTSRTFQETLKEVTRCTRDQIVINTFMLEKSKYLAHFVEQMTKINKGRAFYASPESLGEYILVDYVSSKKKHVK